jgi:hypothetical protein
MKVGAVSAACVVEDDNCCGMCVVLVFRLVVASIGDGTCSVRQQCSLVSILLNARTTGLFSDILNGDVCR